MLKKPTKCWRWKKTPTPYYYYHYYWQWLSLVDDALRDRVKRGSPGIWRSRARETWYKPKNRHHKNTRHIRSCCSSSTHHHHIQKGATLNHLLTLRHLQTTMTATKWAGSAAALGASLSPRRVALHTQMRARKRERDIKIRATPLPHLSRSHARWTYIRIRALHCTYVYTRCNHTYT